MSFNIQHDVSSPTLQARDSKRNTSIIHLKQDFWFHSLVKVCWNSGLLSNPVNSIQEIITTDKWLRLYHHIQEEVPNRNCQENIHRMKELIIYIDLHLQHME